MSPRANPWPCAWLPAFVVAALLAAAPLGCSSGGRAAPEAGEVSLGQLFVDGAAPEGGDGSAAAPFRTVQAAVDAAPAEGVVVVAAGVYPESVRVTADVTLRGSGALETTIEPPDGLPGVVVSDTAEVAIEALAVAGATGVGIAAFGTSLRLVDVEVRDCSAGPSAPGHGIQAADAASLELRGVRVSGCAGAGLVVERVGRTFIIDPTFLPDPEAIIDPTFGVDPTVIIDPTFSPRPAGGSAEPGIIDPTFLVANRFEDNAGGGASIIEPTFYAAGAADVAAGIIDPTFHVTIVGAAFSGNGTFGLLVRGAKVLLDQAVVAETTGAAGFGDGIVAASRPYAAVAGELTIGANVIVTGNARTGVYAAGAWAVEVRAELSKNGAGGLWVQGAGAEAHVVAPAWAAANSLAGLGVTTGASLFVNGVAVEDTVAVPVDLPGVGPTEIGVGVLALGAGSSLNVEGCSITGNASCGILAAGGSTATVTDAVASDNGSREEVLAQAVQTSEATSPFCPSGDIASSGCAPLAPPAMPQNVPIEPSCPAGQLGGPAGVCMAVGIQGCAPGFIEADGVCRPSVDKCPAGTIPEFQAGCVPVGIRGCAPMFVGEDGLCRPSMASCSDAPGTIPKFDEGCVPVGIPDCAAELVGEDGLCRPTAAACAGPDSLVDFDLGCVSIDGPDGCGEAPWGHVEGGASAAYVDPVAGSDLTGTLGSVPFRTLAKALAVVPEGGRVVLAAGVYQEGLTLKEGVEVVGRCASLVTIAGTVEPSAGFEAGVYAWQADGATLRGVTVQASAYGVIAADVADLTLASVRIVGATPYGVRVLAGADVTLDRCLVSGTQPAGGGAARGISVEAGGTATLSRCAVLDNEDAGVVAQGVGTSVTLERTLVEGGRDTDDGMLGLGLFAAEGAIATVRESAVVGNRFRGISIDYPTTALVVERSLLAGNLPAEATGSDGAALEVLGEAEAALSDSALVGNHGLGLFVSMAGSSLNATRCLVGWIVPQGSTDAANGGLWLGNGAQATLTDSALVGNPGVGLYAGNPYSEASLLRVLIEATEPYPQDATNGEGLFVGAGAGADVSDSAFIANHGAGLQAIAVGTSLSATHCLVADTQLVFHELGVPAGMGVFGSDQAQISLDGNAIVSNRIQGVVVDHGSLVTMTANLVRDTLAYPEPEGAGELAIDLAPGLVLLSSPAVLKGNAIIGNRGVGLLAGGAGVTLTAEGDLFEANLPQQQAGNFGVGLQLGDGIAATLSGLAVLDNRGYGMAAFDPGTSVTLAGSLVAGTAPEPSGGHRGLGILGQAGASVGLEGVLLRDNRVAGLMLYEATGSVQASVVGGTAMGSFADADPSELEKAQAGDGLMAASGSVLDVTHTAVFDCARGGIVFAATSSGSVTGSEAARNALGLVRPDPGAVMVDPASLFHDNTDEDVVEEEKAMPSAPSPKIPAPGLAGG